MNARPEVVIVGGGPAGTTTAIALARAAPELAARVILLERARYPREKPCAGALAGRGDRILAALGARPSIPDVPITGMSFRGAAGEASAQGTPIGRVVRRTELDHALAKTACGLGVRVVEDAKVTGVHVEGARAVVESTAGTFDAAFVVGADGVGSTLRRAMGLGSGRLRAQVLELDTEPVQGDRHRGLLHFDTSDHAFSGYIWDFPTIVNGRALVCRGIYHLKIDEQDVDLPARLADYLGRIGLRLRDYEQRRYAERGLDFGDVLGAGPLMLVGEAAGIDPITGEGIAQAIEYGALAGPFVARALRRRTALDGWTRVVHRSRLGVDLAVRGRLVRSFFGPRRTALEGLILDPAALRSFGRYFAGALPAPRALTRTALRLGKLWLATR